MLKMIRTHLHRYPEVSWHEFETTAYIHSILADIAHIEILETGLKTGLIARLEGAHPGPCVALRADIDAIPLVEAWSGGCISTREGVAHGCGHDFHTACLIGAAMRLSKQRESVKGSVIFIFQPAEETTDGAREIIRTGVFEKYGISAIFGLHNRPEIETGKVLVKTGGLMAAKINFKVTVHGVGGHGSMPHKCTDPVVCAAAMVQNVLTISSRNIDPMKALVLSICSIHGGTPQNLVVDTVEMTGAMRWHDDDVGKRALQRLKTVIQATAETFECRADLEIIESVPAVLNRPELENCARRAAIAALGPNCLVESESCLATEDFADYMQIVPGFFFWLGCRKHDETIAYPWHHAMFHVDDDALEGGARLLAECVQMYPTA